MSRQNKAGMGPEVHEEGRLPGYGPSPMMGKAQPFVPGSYIDDDRLSDEAKKLLKPTFDALNFDLGRIRIEFTGIRNNPAETDGDVVRLDRDSWRKAEATPIKRMMILTHEITHSVQFDRLGYWKARMRFAAERWKYGSEGVYDVPGELDRLKLNQINPVDARFTLEAISRRMEAFARTVPPP